MKRIDIPFTRHVLDNGLRIVAHHDPKTPVVTTSLWYHVGSKNESPGRTGFAHLFEHLMFEGSEHHDGEYFRPLEAAGASTINGTTSRDRTNYYETVPVNALDLALWLESDRMGHFLGVMTQEKLDEQREVVRNEKRQSENQPYGRVSALLSRSLYPANHPYSWPIIGSMEDLDAATLDDVREWFEAWYRPNNAVLVVSGAIEPQEAIDRAERQFGDIAAGPPLERPGTWIAQSSDSRRVELEDRVPQARIYRAWNVPPVYTADHHRLSLLTKLLSTGKSSRLYRRLVFEEQIATDAHAYLWSGEMGSSLVLQTTCAPGTSVDEVEEALDQELARLLADGVEPGEIERARNRSLAGFLNGLQRTGGAGGKSEVLAHGEVFGGRPDAYREILDALDAATPESLSEAAADWLGGGALTLTVRPIPNWTSAGASDVDRSRLPDVGRVPRPHFPRPEKRTLSNGLELLWLPWGDLPLARLSYLSAAGFADDDSPDASDLPRGTATLAMQAIDEGTATRTALEISDALATLGSRLGSGAGLDSCRVSMTSLSDRLTESLDLFGEVLRQPTFPGDQVERLKKEQLARIARERSAPVQLALRVLPALLYGAEHPYGTSFTGSGTEATVSATLPAHLSAFHATRLGPERSTLLAVGKTDPDGLTARLESLLGDWRSVAARTDPIPEANPAGGTRVYLLDRPDSIQSIVFGGQVVPQRGHPDELALEAFNHALGGAFTSRLNLNLREDKGWTYGAHSLLWSARGQCPFLLYASVQTDRTADSLREMDREIRAMLDDRPIEDGELEMARTQLVGSLPAQWETLAGIGGALEDLVTYDLPPTYWDDYVERAQALSTEQVTSGASRWLDPGRFVWVVVGDLSTVRQQVESLDIGPVEQISDD